MLIISGKSEGNQREAFEMNAAACFKTVQNARKIEKRPKTISFVALYANT